MSFSAYFSLVKNIKIKRRICKEFYSRNFSQIFSHYFTALFIKMNLTPNIITLSMAIVITPIVYGIYVENVFINFISSLLLVLINILDTSDGEMARYLNKTSKYGDFLDKIVQMYCDLLLITILALKFLSNNIVIFYLIIFYLIIYVINVYTKRLNEIYFIKSKTKLADNKLKLFLSIISSNNFLYHSIWILFLSELLFDNTINSFLAIIYFSHLIILNFLKSVILIYSIKSGT